MKKRNGFVSNSSSSSFILRRSALSRRMTIKVGEFFKKHDGHFETCLDGNLKDDEYMTGDLDAHNTIEGESGTASVLFRDLLEEGGITSKDYCSRYEDYVGPEDLG